MTYRRKYVSILYVEKLRDILDKYNIRADKRFGQNFLTDTNLLEAIIKDAEIGSDSSVLEIGPGTGALTVPLARAAGRVVAIEIDRRLESVLTDVAERFNNLEIIFGDALKMNPEELARIMGGRFDVVANLPYYITSPLIFYFLENDFSIGSMTVMVQKEVADRMTAAHNTAAYGALTAAISLYADARMMRFVPRQMFFPSPDVDSAIVRLKMHDRYKNGKKNALRLIKCAFSMRRKTLINNMMQEYNKSRLECEDILTALSIDIKARGESLTTEQLYNISQKL